MIVIGNQLTQLSKPILSAATIHDFSKDLKSKSFFMDQLKLVNVTVFASVAPTDKYIDYINCYNCTCSNVEALLSNNSFYCGNGSEFEGNATNLVNTTLGNAQGVKKPNLLVSDEIKDIILTINLAVLCQCISVFGMVTSALNLCVFVKQGLNDAVNVTLAGLSLADLCVVIFTNWVCICYNPFFYKLDLPFSPNQFVYLTASLPRLSCARVTSWILAFASLERCLCITKPLTFKSIISPKRSFAFIVGVYVVMAASILPLYHTSRLVKSFDVSRNRSVVRLTFTKDRFQVDNAVFGIGVFLSVASFVSVAVCTAILVWSLKEKTKWRDLTVAHTGRGNQIPLVSCRNKRVGKMISIMSAFFIVCYTPNTVNQLVMVLVQDFAKNGEQINANQVMWSFGILLESINATINIIIYYKMSSRFRSILLAMFNANHTPQYETRVI